MAKYKELNWENIGEELSKLNDIIPLDKHLDEVYDSVVHFSEVETLADEDIQSGLYALKQIIKMVRSITVA